MKQALGLSVFVLMGLLFIASCAMGLSGCAMGEYKPTPPFHIGKARAPAAVDDETPSRSSGGWSCKPVDHEVYDCKHD